MNAQTLCSQAARRSAARSASGSELLRLSYTRIFCSWYRSEPVIAGLRSSVTCICAQPETEYAYPISDYMRQMRVRLAGAFSMHFTVQDSRRPPKLDEFMEARV